MEHKEHKTMVARKGEDPMDVWRRYGVLDRITRKQGVQPLDLFRNLAKIADIHIIFKKDKGVDNS